MARGSNRTTYKCHAEVRDGALHVEIVGRGRQSWTLPADKSDHDQIRRICARAIQWAMDVSDGKITDGQDNAIGEALSDAKYFRQPGYSGERHRPARPVVPSRVDYEIDGKRYKVPKEIADLLNNAGKREGLQNTSD